MNGLALLNCRESDIVISVINELKRVGRNSLQDYQKHFPKIAESIGGAKRILLSHDVGVRAHFREISTEKTIKLFKSMKHYLKYITSEVRPDHLFLNIENTRTLGPFAQQWTPLRQLSDSDKLWKAINDGTIDLIASDHATHTKEEKEKGQDNIWKSPPGLPAIESMLPLLLSSVNQGKISLERLFECSSSNPAKVLGLYPKKGALKVGSDADLVIVDIKKESIINGKNSKAKTHWTPYEGWKVKGMPVATYVRGIETYNEGEILVKPGQGKFLSL